MFTDKQGDGETFKCGIEKKAGLRPRLDVPD
jgi:hypothetical protein